MTEDLDTVRKKLYEAFEVAVNTGKVYYTSSVGPESLKAAASLAEAIVTVENKIEERQLEKNTLKLPGKG
jgi:hypothetical protein